MTNEDIIRRVLRYEGGFVNDPLDRGGATNRGITAATLGAWRKLGRAATVDEVRDMPEAEAIAIYTRNYIERPSFDRIADMNLRMITVDAGVLHGTARAAKWLQIALGVGADGAIGNRTITALDAANPARIVRQMLAARYAFFGDILAANPAQKRFARGWFARVTDLLLDFA